jgi:hypothetical protein
MPPKRSTRPAKKVKRDTAATETDINAALQSQSVDTFEQVFAGFDDHDNVSDASDASDYVGRRRKQPAGRRVRKQAKRPARKLTMTRPSITPAPIADEMSDKEYDSEGESGINFLKPRPRATPNVGRKQAPSSEATAMSTGALKQVQLAPNILQIHVMPGRESGGSTINVDLIPLLKAHNIDTTTQAISPDNDSTLVDDLSGLPLKSPTKSSLRLKRLNDAKARAAATQKTKTGFTDLPNEIRVRIYRMVFVTEAPMNFSARNSLQRSGSMLRTCKIAHEEGRAVLYSENAFHFERSVSARGKFFEETWREIGFKDIRRFLETIGTTNISLMRYISFDFGDASKVHGPIEEAERRFVHDPVVWRCLELVGANAHLAKFAFQFSGRRNVDRIDLHFLKALTSIKAQEVANVASWSGGFKVKAELVADIKKLMVAPLDDPDKVDGKKKKAPTVVMFHERDRGTKYFGTSWR